MISHTYQRTGKNGVIDIMTTMKKIIIDNDIYDSERLVKETAKDITKFRQPTDEIGQIQDIFTWVKSNLKYYRDTHGSEEITYPYLILKSIKEKRNIHSADCDDYAVLLCSLLRAIGFKTRIEVVALQKNQYNHARCGVYSEKLKRWFSLEATSISAPIGKAFPSRMPILALEI